MYIVLYMKCIWCNGFPEIYAQLEDGVGSIYHGYMCIKISARSAKFGVVVVKASMLN